MAAIRCSKSGLARLHSGDTRVWRRLAQSLRVVNAQPLSHPAAHGNAIGMSPLNPHLVQHGHSVLRKAGAHAVPLAVVAGLACQQEQGRASAMALKVQAGAVGGGGEGHGSMGG